MDKNSPTKKSGAYESNMLLPVHRWFQYSESFPAQWVESLVAARGGSRSNLVVLDPFAGSGTTLLACDRLGVTSYGYEAHPFIYRMASGKLLWRTNPALFRQAAEEILAAAGADASQENSLPAFAQKCFGQQNALEIDHLKKALTAKRDGAAYTELSWIAFAGILRSLSLCRTGTADLRYVLPHQRKGDMPGALASFQNQISIMSEDLAAFQSGLTESKATLLCYDARKTPPLPKGSVDFVISSPPCTDSFDYLEAAYLELLVLDGVLQAEALKNQIRRDMIRSCALIMAQEKNDTFKYLQEPLLKPIYHDILNVCTQLNYKKIEYSGKKNYHTMLALYFLDLARTWQKLRYVCREGASVCFVIGDCAPLGVYVPVGEWLGKLALAAGFHEYRFEKLRSRSTTQETGSDAVSGTPIWEGELWVIG